MSTVVALHPAHSAFSAFHHRTFAVLWTATVVSNIGGWMYSAASAWLMTTLAPSPLAVSLVQVATSLPTFLFAVLAGARRPPACAPALLGYLHSYRTGWSV